MPHSATSAIPNTYQFIAINTATDLYDECHAVTFTSIRHQSDALVDHAIDSKLARESTSTISSAIFDKFRTLTLFGRQISTIPHRFS